MIWWESLYDICKLPLYIKTKKQAINSNFYISDILERIVQSYLKEYDFMLGQDGTTAHSSRKTI